MMVSHDELNRSLGRMEGELGALKDVLEEIRRDLTAIKTDVAELKMKEGQRSVIEKAAIWLAGVLGAALTMIAEHLLK